MGTLANCEDPNEIPHLLHIIRVYNVYEDFRERNRFFKFVTCDPSICTMDHPDFIGCSLMENSIGCSIFRGNLGGVDTPYKTGSTACSDCPGNCKNKLCGNVFFMSFHSFYSYIRLSYQG